MGFSLSANHAVLYHLNDKIDNILSNHNRIYGKIITSSILFAGRELKLIVLVNCQFDEFHFPIAI